jgi:hypothetical protein
MFARASVDQHRKLIFDAAASGQPEPYETWMTAHRHGGMSFLQAPSAAGPLSGLNFHCRHLVAEGCFGASFSIGSPSSQRNYSTVEVAGRPDK